MDTPYAQPARPRRWWVLAAAAAALLVLAPPAGRHAASAAVPPPPAGWSLVWSDDFNGPAGTLPSSSNWIFDLGTSYPGGPPNWGTGEVETMTSNPANVSTDGNGNLRITPLRDAAGRWTSARIETVRTDFQPPPGGRLRVQASIAMPDVTGAAALGYWPAFWMLGAPYRGNYQNWPSVGEFDIMENVNGINSVWGVFHCGVAPGGPCNEFSGIGASRPCPGTPCQGNFHTYTLEWDRSATPEQIRWFVDGIQYHSISQSQFDATTWANATSHGYFIILNVAMGGSFPNGVAGTSTPTAATASGVPMLIDYVAVYQAGGTAPPTTAPPGGGTSAYTTIQAEAFTQQSGIQTEPTSDVGGGQNIGWIANGDWALYRGLDFGSTPARQLIARVASGAGPGISGLVEVRLDSRSNPPVGSFAIANTGGWQSWRTVPANISGVTGTHDVYLTFTSGQPADFVNVNWFTFSR